MKSRPPALAWAAVWLFALGALMLQRPARPAAGNRPTLYAVAQAHLDSQWLWSYPQTITWFLPQTLRANFALIADHPHYIFNFSGANRYRMIKEYYPEDYARLKGHVSAGRWFPCGSSMEECEANVPDPESIVRQILYGNGFFRSEFGKDSCEFMLPDSFGFPASLPSLLAHCGLRGFSTQKLNWGSGAPAGGPDSPQQTPAGIPFNIGFWQGADGRGVVAALNVNPYDSEIWYDLSARPDLSGFPSRVRQRMIDWPARVRRNGRAGGVFADYMYYGTGDRGGAPARSSVRMLEAILDKKIFRLPQPPKRFRTRRPGGVRETRVGMGPLRIVSATAEQMFLDIRPGQLAGLPRFQGEIQLTNHSAGILTSQAYVKRWNRRSEVLAGAAERAALAAEWLGGPAYPRQRLQDAWALTLGAQFHDILAGTCIAEAYRHTWNDQILAMNQFAQVLSGSAGAVASALDTRSEGMAVLVFNDLEFARQDVVEAAVAFNGPLPKAVRVYGPDGGEVPAQIGPDARVIFLARVPALGFAVYDVRPARVSHDPAELKVSTSSMENHRYRVSLDANGDVAGIYDKTVSRELLAAPLHLEIKTDDPEALPAWNMDWADQMRAPRSRIGGPAALRVLEQGPARVAVEIRRRCEGSEFIQTIRLAAGEAGNRLELANTVDWRTRRAHLKAVFPLSAANPVATFHTGLGPLQRRSNSRKQFEFAFQQWFDQTDAGGAYGVSVLSDCKYGSDKPDSRTLRLTLLRTPGTRGGLPEQGRQDLGRHEFVFGLAAHAGDWRAGRSDRHAYRLNHPLAAFQVRSHAGVLGRSFSFLELAGGAVRLLALKKSETSDEIILRLVETDGAGTPELRLRFPSPVRRAREVDGQERNLGRATIRDGQLIFRLAPHQIRSFAVSLVARPPAVTAVRAVALHLPREETVASRDGQHLEAGMDGSGSAFPAEMLPGTITYKGVAMDMSAGRNAVICRGQTVSLPRAGGGTLYLLAAADGDQRGSFVLGAGEQTVLIQDWRGTIGQWQRPIWSREGAVAGMAAGFIKEAPVAWFASHHHSPGGANVPYSFCYIFAYELRVPDNAREIGLPCNPKIRLFAASFLDSSRSLHALHPLIDSLRPPAERVERPVR